MVIIRPMADSRRNLAPLILLLIILLAAFLRFWRLGELPPGLYHDEAYYGLDALSLDRGDTFPRYYEGWELYANDAHAEHPASPTRFPVFFEGNYGREPLHVYLVALSIRLFGNTPFAIRAVAAAAGTLACFIIWLAARALFPPAGQRKLQDDLLPLLAAFSLATLYPALNFSRFGIRAMTMLPVTSFAVYAFWRGWHKGSALWLAIGGFFVGASLYTFAAARLFPFVFIFFGVYLLLFERAQLREKWRGLALATATAVLAAAPLLLYFLRNPYFFLFRIAFVANRGEGVVENDPALTWLLNVQRVIGGLFWRGEMHLRHNLPGRPYFDPIQSVLFLLGAVRGLRFWRKPAYTFLLLWFGVMLLPSVFSGDAPHFGRLIGAAPPAALLVAIGLAWLADTIARATSRSWAALAVVVVLSASSLFLTTRDYFVRWANQPDLARDFYQADWDLGRFAASQPADASLYLTPTQEEMATIYFALGDPDRLRSFNGQNNLIPAGVPGHPAVYLIRTGADKTVANLQKYFPTGELGEAQDGFISFKVPPDAERVRTRMEADTEFSGLIRLAGYTVERQDTRIKVTLAWQSSVVTTVDFTAFVHLLDGTGALIAQADHPPAGYPTSDWRSGEIVIDRFFVELPSEPIAGEYHLQTGFYDPATVQRLGDAVRLEEKIVLP